MKLISKLKMSHRLMAAFFFVGMVPAGIISWIMLDNLKQNLEMDVDHRLTSIREAKSTDLVFLFEQMQGQLQTLSSNALIVEGMREFKKSFFKYGPEHQSRPDLDQVKSSLKNYYLSQFGETFKSNNGGEPAPDPLQRLGSLSQTELLFQYEYISNNTHPLGEKHNLFKAKDGTSWSKMHEKVHPTLKKYLETFGYYDIFLVEPEKGHIVYSVFKELDFATSLISGPYANTNFGRAFKMALQATNPDQVFVTDLEPYYPSYNAAAGFISSPIFENGEMSGVLIFQIPTDKIDNIMTVKGKWQENGFGNTGEVYAVGKDSVMRTVSRAFVEGKEDYLKNAADYGLVGDKLKYASNKGSTVLAQSIDNKAFKAALNGENGFVRVKNYRGKEVFSSYKPVNLLGIEWYVFSEIEAEEGLHLGSIRSLLAMILGGSALIILLVSWFSTKALTKKLGEIVSRLGRSTNSTRESSAYLKGTSEDVANAATRQAAAIQETVSTLNEITAMVDKSVEYASESADKSRDCERVAFDGKKAVEEMSRSMEEIKSCNTDISDAVGKSNDEIGGIVAVIQEIAEKTNVINDIVFQTKLLSFNASVEAARAGEHGKGFAVVAEEVGNLAEMSGTAANEIGGMLSESIQKVESIVKRTSVEIARLVDTGQAKVNTGVEVAQRCGQVLDEVVTNVSSVNKMMDEVSQAAKEQAEGVGNITVAMNDLDQSTHTNSNAAQQAKNYAQKLESESELLDQLVSELSQQVYGGQAKAVKHLSENLSENVIKLVSKEGDNKEKQQKSSGSEKAHVPRVKKAASGDLVDSVPDYSDPDFEEL